MKENKRKFMPNWSGWKSAELEANLVANEIVFTPPPQPLDKSKLNKRQIKDWTRSNELMVREVLEDYKVYI